jgi:type I restriction enzyme R subunit
MNRYEHNYALFDGKGGIGKMHQLFADEMGLIIDEMNEALAA